MERKKIVLIIFSCILLLISSASCSTDKKRNSISIYLLDIDLNTREAVEKYKELYGEKSISVKSFHVLQAAYRCS